MSSGSPEPWLRMFTNTLRRAGSSTRYLRWGSTGSAPSQASRLGIRAAHLRPTSRSPFDLPVIERRQLCVGRDRRVRALAASGGRGLPILHQ